MKEVMKGTNKIKLYLEYIAGRWTMEAFAAVREYEVHTLQVALRVGRREYLKKYEKALTGTQKDMDELHELYRKVEVKKFSSTN